MKILLDNNYEYNKIDKNNFKKLSNISYNYQKTIHYAPDIFKSLRDYWSCNEDDYMKELSNLYGGDKGAGKSGMLMWRSKTKKYLIKTITKFEYWFFFNQFKKYYDHMKSNPNTLLSKFYGIYYLEKKYVIVMNNVFYNAPNNMWVYDLKGSRRHRTTEEEQNQDLVLKDNNFGNINIFVHNQKWINQVQKDSLFLKNIDSMDYSLIIGIIESNKNIKNSYTQFNTTMNGPPPVFCNKKVIVYCGIIDFLQEFNLYKQGERIIKTKRMSKIDYSDVSAIPSKYYQLRFIRFIKQHFKVKNSKNKKTHKKRIQKRKTKRKS